MRSRFCRRAAEVWLTPVKLLPVFCLDPRFCWRAVEVWLTPVKLLPVFCLDPRFCRRAAEVWQTVAVGGRATHGLSHHPRTPEADASPSGRNDHRPQPLAEINGRLTSVFSVLFFCLLLFCCAFKCFAQVIICTLAREEGLGALGKGPYLLLLRWWCIWPYTHSDPRLPTLFLRYRHFDEGLFYRAHKVCFFSVITFCFYVGHSYYVQFIVFWPP